MQNGWAQGLNFSEKKWNFGTIKEEGGDVSHIFQFVNDSQSPIVIVNVRTTCGCTTPKYSRKPIAPNERAEMTVTFDPRFRPGVFSKDITIITSQGGDPIVLTITGDVTPRELSVEERYPYVIGGGVRIGSLYANMGNVEHGKPRQTQIELINTSSKPRSVELRSGSKYLTLPPKQVIEAGARATVDVTYEVAQESGFYGLMDDYVDIDVDGHRSNMTLNVRGYAVDKFDDFLKKEGASGCFSEKIINFGTLKRSRSNLTKTLSIENLGVSDLFVRSINLPDGVTLQSEQGGVVGVRLPSARNMELSITLQREKLELGAFVKYITFVVNDPEQPVVRVKVVAQVSE